MKMQIEVEDRDWMLERVVERLLESLYERERDSVGAAVQKTVDRLVSENADKMIAEALKAPIEAAIAGDFGEVDSYGNHKRKNLRGLIVACFTTGQYSSKSMIQGIAEETIAKLMKEEFQPQVDEARKYLRGRLDGLLGEKVSLAVREAVGLK